MTMDDYIPPSYRPLSPISSEARDKYRWPRFQAPRHGSPKRDMITIDGLLQSPPSAPRLRYHRQSHYTDAYGEEKPFHIRRVDFHTVRTDWLEPVGLSGDFYHDTTYDSHYVWPDMPERTPRIPIFPTVGLGIIPLLGRGGDSKDASTMLIDLAKAATDERREALERMKIKRLSKKKPTSEDYVHPREMWPTETIHRKDFEEPLDAMRTEKAKPPPSALDFSGEIDLTTTAMHAFRDPKDVIPDEDVIETPSKPKEDLQSRFPYFLF